MEEFQNFGSGISLLGVVVPDFNRFKKFQVIEFFNPVVPARKNLKFSRHFFFNSCPPETNAQK